MSAGLVCLRARIHARVLACVLVLVRACMHACARTCCMCLCACCLRACLHPIPGVCDCVHTCMPTAEHSPSRAHNEHCGLLSGMHNVGAIVGLIVVGTCVSPGPSIAAAVGRTVSRTVNCVGSTDGTRLATNVVQAVQPLHDSRLHRVGHGSVCCVHDPSHTPPTVCICVFHVYS